MDIKPPLTNTFELIMQAGAFLDFLPPSRARSMVGTKLDEAILWLTQVDPDGPLTDEGQAQADDPFGIWPEDDAPENLTQTLIREGREILKEWPEGQKLMEERTARELNREAEEACKELGISYPEPTPEERRLLRSLLDRIKREQPKKEYKAGEPHFDAEQAASGIEALNKSRTGWRGHAYAWSNEVRRLTDGEKLRALSQMRGLVKAIEQEEGFVIDGAEERPFVRPFGQQPEGPNYHIPWHAKQILSVKACAIRWRNALLSMDTIHRDVELEAMIETLKRVERLPKAPLIRTTEDDGA